MDWITGGGKWSWNILMNYPRIFLERMTHRGHRVTGFTGRCMNPERLEYEAGLLATGQKWQPVGVSWACHDRDRSWPLLTTHPISSVITAGTRNRNFSHDILFSGNHSNKIATDVTVRSRRRNSPNSRTRNHPTSNRRYCPNSHWRMWRSGHRASW